MMPYFDVLNAEESEVGFYTCVNGDILSYDCGMSNETSDFGYCAYWESKF